MLRVTGESTRPEDTRASSCWRDSGKRWAMPVEIARLRATKIPRPRNRAEARPSGTTEERLTGSLCRSSSG
jgi:hypothetical protein